MKRDMKPVCYRQGDVFIIPVAGIPSGGLHKSHGSVLALGEVTGHSHRLATPQSGGVSTVDGNMYLEVMEGGADVIHEEHGTISLPAGAYQIRIQREYTPAGIRRVYD